MSHPSIIIIKKRTGVCLAGRPPGPFYWRDKGIGRKKEKGERTRERVRVRERESERERETRETEIQTEKQGRWIEI